MEMLHLEEFTLAGSAPVEGDGLGCSVRSQPFVPVPAGRRYGAARGLSAYHRRCLDKRIGDCNDALTQAVCALCEAKSWEPCDVRLQAVCGLLQAAHSLTDLAHDLCRNGTSDLDADGGRIRP